jgi:hypothetical protein
MNVELTKPTKQIERHPTVSVSLDRCPALLDGAPNCQAFLEAWRGWRHNSAVPGEKDVIAEDFGSAFGSVSVLEARAQDSIIYRLCGSLHSHIAGIDLTGMNVVDLTPKKARDMRMHQMWHTATMPCGTFFVIAFSRESGFQTLVRGLALPVAPKTASGPMLLFVAVDDMNRTLRPPVKPIDLIPPAHETAFIDLGFGTPQYYD